LTIEYTPEARHDLVDAIDRIHRENPSAAAHLADRLLSRIERLAAGDFEGVELALTTGEHVRSWPVPPYRIYYRREPDRLLVVRVYHQAREPIAR
jgi:plasmid stabilization system protein ParE